ncbi:ATPase family AAA domain-containing protein 1 [Marchantia polymorpha subsp. ruderalis]|uniref:AAA+ ATPase domain-containing protein n=2 Tax=Marchantia polymorpha TaxID=3197 RepID=A0AAF6AZI9_MARPO|nr:hypothetical protein MARPO_0037s0104 [Marchantia polymorpha]BBN05173.1 hypothetical protein Mp_3g10920 [Marchantia polymorpha subsp. ruderalis]|eukprot:PTQ40933.1 hypothetical protein MARPO_0037s0104 [Marchantia polymorpha]
MERKHIVAVTVGAVGVGLALAATPVLLRRNDSLALQRELVELVQLGKDGSVTVQDLPYYLNDQACHVLTNAAYVHLKQAQFSKFTSQLSAASQAILLSGPEGSEAYHQRVAKALAHNFEAKLLLLDVTDLVSKSKVGALTRKRNARQFAPKDVARSLFSWIGTSKKSTPERTTSSNQGRSCADCGATADKVQKSEGFSGKVDVGAGKSRRAVYFEEEIFVDALFKVLTSLAETSPVVVYLRDVENFFFKGPKMYSLFLSKMEKMQGPIMILGSKIKPAEGHENKETIEKKLKVLFRYSISVKPPEDNVRLVSWKSQVEEDMKAIQAQDNRNRIIEVLCANNIECDDIASVGFSDTQILSNCIEEVVTAAFTYHLQHNETPQYRGGHLLISAKSLSHGLAVFQMSRMDSNKLQSELKSEPNKEVQEILTGKGDGKTEIPVAESKTDSNRTEPKPETAKTDASKSEAPKPFATPAKPADVAPDNEFEKRIRPEVIPAGEIGVNFNDIGALENVKESLQELVMLPLRRPEFFNRGGLIKRCKGILLFGPPGTGKTMLAKAVATEAGASFINVSMSAITSKWFGEDEKNVRALFTLAAKVSPTVIFIDEVDSMLGQRCRVGEHEAMRKIKNEFMAHWDGLLTKGGERVLVLAATNRPFDLDEAIIRRFERRIMVGLPDVENREKILRAILAKENLHADFDFKEVAALTEGYSGSDLKNLCVTAAYRPIREHLAKERKEEKRIAALKEAKRIREEEAKKAGKEIEIEEEIEEAATDITLRSLNLDDIREAKQQVSASFASEGTGMQELQEWNDLYGEGGSRKKQQLTYFL